MPLSSRWTELLRAKKPLPDRPRHGLPGRCVQGPGIRALMLLMLLCLAGPASARADQGTITAATPGFFPPQYSLDSSGRPQGFAIDIMNAIAGLAGLEVEFLVMDNWAQAQEALKTGRADVLPNVGITERRKGFLDFTSPVETFPVVLFVRSDTESIQGLNDLTGRRVAVVKINVGYALIKDRDDLELVLASDRQDGLFMLLSGQVDALVYPEPLVRLDARRAGIEDHIKVVGQPLQEIKRGIGVAKGHPELLRKLDRAVQQFVNTPTYRRIYTRWYGQPEPFLTPQRVAIGAGLLLGLLVLCFLVWRTRLQKRVALEMERKVRDRTAELKKSEDLFRKIYEHMAVGVARVSLDFRIEAANEAYCRMLGYSEQELIGRHLSDITHPEVLEENLDRQTMLTRGVIDHYRMEKRFIHKNGAVIQGILDANLVRDAGGQPFFFLGSVLDITERKQAEEALLESEERFKLAMEASRDGLWDWNVETGEVYYSPAYAAMLGYSPEEVPQRASFWMDHIHPDDRETAIRANNDCIEHACDDFEIEFRMLSKDGGWRWILGRGKAVGRDDQGRALRMIGTQTDITERKKAERALRESERRLSTLMSNLPGMAYRCRNDRDWTMEFVSNGCIELTGYWTEELVGNAKSSYAELVHPEDRAMVWNRVQDALTRKRNFEIEYRIITREGLQKHVWEKGVGIFDDEQLLFLEGFIADITERKLAEEEREQLQAQLLQAQKMESVGRLAGGVAHDLNNMLVAILGYGELLMADAELGDDHRKRIELMYQAGLRSRNLVSQLLAFSRKQTLQVECLDLNEVISDFTRLLEKTIRENIEIQFDLAPQLPTVNADRSQLEQVILNLAVNAQDAMSEGGRLTIETGMADLDERYASQHVGVVPGRYVMLAVSDTGFGMDRETREQIFEPFFTTKKPGEGTGLGLATVYGIVKQHQGSIWVYSEPGQGTTLKIYLPTDGPAPSGSIAAAPSRPMQTRGRETVLVVEDDEMVRELAVSVLEDQGYTVHAAASGQECLEVMQSAETPFDLLLTDVIMPDMDGKDLYDRVARLEPKIRILYMSGYTDNVISHHGVLDPDVAFLQKPFSFQDLCLKVREVLDQA